MGVVDDPACQFRKRRARPRDPYPEPRQNRQEDADQNFTFGATCASGAAVNSAIGLLLE